MTEPDQDEASMQLNRAKVKIDQVKLKIHRTTTPYDRGKINLDRGIMACDRRNERPMPNSASSLTHQPEALHNTLTVAHRPWRIDSDRGAKGLMHQAWPNSPGLGA
ncbi:hypothetical protein TanjilG_07377 [Lupinus angustifolius]|uniref:Uncharacterized protein n=1 Tax=Lupinus angustifolius TaxID=3871 RepID=A0A4P1R0G9_LUPAN|nr:hypothetical protein TanjilG_07377 [Lupinus angustifolius]